MKSASRRAIEPRVFFFPLSLIQHDLLNLLSEFAQFSRDHPLRRHSNLISQFDQNALVDRQKPFLVFRCQVGQNARGQGRHVIDMPRQNAEASGRAFGHHFLDFPVQKDIGRCINL